MDLVYKFWKKWSSADGLKRLKVVAPLAKHLRDTFELEKNLKKRKFKVNYVERTLNDYFEDLREYCEENAKGNI